MNTYEIRGRVEHLKDLSTSAVNRWPTDKTVAQIEDLLIEIEGHVIALRATINEKRATAKTTAGR